MRLLMLPYPIYLAVEPSDLNIVFVLSGSDNPGLEVTAGRPTAVERWWWIVRHLH